MEKRIRLVIVEDNRLLREGLTVMLKEQPDITVLASLSSGDALVRGKRLKPDVILIDFVLRGSTSLRLVQSIKKSNPKARVIVMDLAPVQPSLIEFVRAGVDGFVLKDATFDDFLQTVRNVAQGKKVLPPTLTSSLLSEIATHATKNGKGNPFKSVRMTGRELSNKQIASRLNLAVDTVKSHVHSILEKLALHTRLEIATYRHLSGRFPTSPDEDSSSAQ
jgi:DNA-binding NarL/FixJ family response regulator